MDKTGVATHVFSYDNQGRRIAKTVGSTTTGYLYNGPDIMAEYGGDWQNPVARYTHGPGVDDPIIRAAG